MSRDKLAAYLWRESDTESARHALAQTLYSIRHELSADLLVTAGNDVCLSPDTITVDRWEFEAALAKGNHEEAVDLYTGPFLDGFYIRDAPEFERWSEEERARLARQFRTALEALAAASETRRDPRAVIEWRRRAVAADPLDSRLALQYMKALVAVGDRAGALQHARVHETLLKQELRVQPDDELSAFTRRLREQPSQTQSPLPPTVAAPLSMFSSTPSAVPSSPPTAPGASEETSARPSVPWSWRWRRMLGAALVVIAAVATFAFVLRPRSSEGVATPSPVIAVGNIREYGGSDTSGIVRALSEMLSTNIARVPRLHVISNARVYEILGQMGSGGEGGAGRIERAAERAGATEIVDGDLYRRPGASLRFDLRRVDLATGTVRAAYSVEGRDLFVLVDSATAQFARDLNVSAGRLRIADVTTSSLVAQRFYDEGLRAWYQEGDGTSALRLFQLALREDSTFAMAAFYASIAALSLGQSSYLPVAERALELAGRAGDRERLVINAELRHTYNDPRARAYADSLSQRFPNEPDGFYLLALVKMDEGDFTGAVPLLRHVIAMDSLSVSGHSVRCRACDAYYTLVECYWFADSLEAAERSAREFLARRPQTAGALVNVGGVLENQGRGDDALHYYVQAARFSGDRMVAPQVRAKVRIRQGRFVEADQLLEVMAYGNDVGEGERDGALWFVTISYRYQGRLRDAEWAARRLITTEPGDDGARQGYGQVLLEQGRYAEAAHLYDSLAEHPTYPARLKPRVARQVSWNLVHVATAVAAMGDTARLKNLADSLQSIGGLSGWGRDNRLHHYARGMLERARGNEQAAVEQLRRAIWSPSAGFTLANLELGRALVALGRPTEAIPVVRSALHGSLESSNMYVAHTDLHELLARAFDQTNQRDSAALHYRWVVNAWQRADPVFRGRLVRAEARLAALTADARVVTAPHSQ